MRLWRSDPTDPPDLSWLRFECTCCDTYPHRPWWRRRKGRS